MVLLLDSQKTYRVFENLIVNITKYGMPHTRVYIDLIEQENGVTVTMKNVSAAELNFNPDEITARFVRGDSSRNTEGVRAGAGDRPELYRVTIRNIESFDRRGSVQGGDLFPEENGDCKVSERMKETIRE